MSKKCSTFAANFQNGWEMDIKFKDTKENNVYEQYVNDPTDRGKFRAFTKEYSKQIASEAVKLHNRLLSHESAGSYNRMFGTTNNRIETKKGTKQNECMCFKVRVTGAWRKFFHQKIGEELLITKNWTGDFDGITSIYVCEINKHDYDTIH